MKNKKRKIRSEKGSITIFVIVTMLFIVIASLLLYSRVMNNKSTENRQVKQIESQYSVSNDQLAEAYNDVSSHVTVTFDANGGQVSTSPKRVKIGDSYGSLPTPTRDGYKFMGWNGKNLASTINEQSYSIILNYHDYTSTEFVYGNDAYIRFKGIESSSRLDTAWFFLGNNKIELNPNTTYNLNFDIRSLNSVQNTYIALSNTYGATGYTGIYDISINNPIDIKAKLIKSIEKSINFDNDGNWHNVNTTIIVPSDVNEAKLVIGNDSPDLYGKDSYIDIKNLQLEEGTEATEYEPYFVTNSTKVTQTKNHTLKAIWEEE